MTIEEILKTDKFDNIAHKAALNLLITSTWINQNTAKTLKPFGISTQQFNILRILRGLSPKSATVKLLTERMIDKMSNASRLVDKLKDKGLVERTESSMDRRRVDISITKEGLRVVNEASDALTLSSDAQFSTLNNEELTLLSDMLDKLRSGEE